MSDTLVPHRRRRRRRTRRVSGPAPDFPQPPIAPPGLTGEMTPRPDHGETSYRGLGRLAGRSALDHRRRQRHRPRRRHRLRARGRRRADQLPARRRSATAPKPRGGSSRPAARAVARPATSATRRTAHRSSIAPSTSSAASTSWSTTPPSSAPTTSIEDLTTDEFDRDVPDQRLRDVLVVPRGAAAHEAGQRDHQHGVDPGLRSRARTCSPTPPTKGAIVNFTKGAVAARDEAGRPRQRGRAGAGLDAADSLDDDRGEGAGSSASDTAFGRAAQPVELAPLFVFLASNEARFVTGEVYGATGGQTPV